VTRKFESPETCPEELLLFFHHVPYTCRLDSGKTVIQHIYDSHYRGVEQARGLREDWKTLKGRIDAERYAHVLDRLNKQIEHAKKWRDAINQYFHKLSGIPAEKGRF
jgi:alpha-glucuronidase